MLQERLLESSLESADSLSKQLRQRQNECEVLSHELAEQVRAPHPSHRRARLICAPVAGGALSLRLRARRVDRRAHGRRTLRWRRRDERCYAALIPRVATWQMSSASAATS